MKQIPHGNSHFHNEIENYQIATGNTVELLLVALVVPITISVCASEEHSRTASVKDLQKPLAGLPVCILMLSDCFSITQNLQPAVKLDVVHRKICSANAKARASRNLIQ